MLAERVTAYWKARSDLNLHEAFEYYASSFKEQYTANSFARTFRRLNRFAPELVEIESLDIDPSGVKAAVRVLLRFEPPLAEVDELTAFHGEDWVLEDGEWWKADEPLLPNL